MGYITDDQGRKIIEGKLSSEEMECLLETSNQLEFYVAAIDNNAISAYLDDSYNCLREHLTELALENVNLSDVDVDVWAEGEGLVGIRFTFPN